MLRFKVQLLDTEADEIPVTILLREGCHEAFRGTIYLFSLQFIEDIAVLLTESRVTLFKGIEAEFSDTVHMPERIRKIDPFLASVSTYRGIKQIVDSGVCLIQKSDQVGFGGSLLLS